MEQNNQVYTFDDDFNKLVERCRSEFDSHCDTLVGVIFMQSQLLRKEAADEKTSEAE